jgi:hypothetical protein
MPSRLSASDIKAALQEQPKLSSELAENYEDYQRFFAKRPEKHKWVFNSDVSLRAKLEHSLASQASKRNALPANQVYWSDILQSILAAEHIFYFRSEALIESTIRSLTDRDLLSAAILARSLLEVCMWHLYHSVIFEKSTKPSLMSTATHLIDNSELQDMLLKLIWGSKQKDIIEEVKQHNVLKIFGKVSKSLKDSDFDVEESYDFLSELSHPNVEGNNVFIDEDINANRKPLFEVVFEISSQQHDTKAKKISECCCETLIWCMRSIIFASEKYQAAERNIVKGFELGKRKIH